MKPVLGTGESDRGQRPVACRVLDEDGGRHRQIASHRLEEHMSSGDQSSGRETTLIDNEVYNLITPV